MALINNLGKYPVPWGRLYLFLLVWISHDMLDLWQTKRISSASILALSKRHSLPSVLDVVGLCTTIF